MVALGHIIPSANEPDSEMYQSVATEGVQLISEATDLPLITQKTQNIQKCRQLLYSVEKDDEGKRF